VAGSLSQRLLESVFVELLRGLSRVIPLVEGLRYVKTDRVDTRQTSGAPATRRWGWRPAPRGRPLLQNGILKRARSVADHGQGDARLPLARVDTSGRRGCSTSEISATPGAGARSARAQKESR
jgi:hypothetical protein